MSVESLNKSNSTSGKKARTSATSDPALNLMPGQERGSNLKRLFHQKRFRDFARCGRDGEHRQAFVSATGDCCGDLAVAFDLERGGVGSKKMYRESFLDSL